MVTYVTLIENNNCIAHDLNPAAFDQSLRTNNNSGKSNSADNSGGDKLAVGSGQKDSERVMVFSTQKKVNSTTGLLKCFFLSTYADLIEFP